MLTLFEMFRTLLLLLVVMETHGSDNGKLCNCFGMVEFLQRSVMCVFQHQPVTSTRGGGGHTGVSGAGAYSGSGLVR
jgi:hypothetical protein